MTDSSGTVALLNVPAGTTTITMKVAATSAVAGTYAVPIRAGTVTELYMLPTP
jgi:hypothetical protein